MRKVLDYNLSDRAAADKEAADKEIKAGASRDSVLKNIHLIRALKNGTKDSVRQ